MNPPTAGPGVLLTFLIPGLGPPALEPPAWPFLSSSPMAWVTSCHLARVTLDTHLGMVSSLLCLPWWQAPLTVGCGPPGTSGPRAEVGTQQVPS